jgi:hypothetical protein
VPASEFGAGGPLAGWLSSTGADATQTVDGNDNGIDDAAPATNGIRSNVFTLAVGAMPTGEDQTGYPGDLLDDSVNATDDFGFYDPAIFRPAAIGNRVWLDENGDGVQDAGEAGIGNVEVQLYPAGGGDLIASTVTDADGGYLFPVLFGDYRVVVVRPAGLEPTYDEDGTITPDQIDNISVAAGDEHLTADFGYNWVTPAATTNPGTDEPGALGDRIWNDADGDGVQDPGEAGIAGVEVQLYADLDGDGIYGDLVDTVSTDATGNYIFRGIDPTAYEVVVNTATLPPNFDPNPTGDPDGDGDNRSLPIPIAPGDVFVNADFGYRLDPAGAETGSDIGDLIWLDADGDGVPDAGEPGIAGVTVELRDELDRVIATTVTDATGSYRFPGLPAGTYTVFITDTENVLDERVETTDGTAPTTVNGNDDDLTQDFGFAASGAAPGVGYIGDTIFLDTGNGFGGAPDGQYQPGEGLEGVRVDLYDAAGLVLLDTAYTDENGNYGFGGLDATSSYEVRVDTGTLPNDGFGLDNTVDPDGNGDSRTVRNLAQDGPVDLGADFGYQTTVVNGIEGTIWEDSNADGLLDSGTEAGNGLGGVTVVLVRDLNGDGAIDGNDPIVAQTVTDADGNYSFPNLPNGDYLVQVTDDAGLLSGYWHSIGPDPDEDNNSQATPYAVSLTGGQTDNKADFGYYRTLAAVGNRLWLDLNNNGIQDEGEPAAVDIPVKLTLTYPNDDIVDIVTRSDENGFYSFPNLLADEQFNGSGSQGSGGETPSHVLGINAFPFGFDASPIGQGTDPLLDSSDPLGTLADILQGENNVAAEPNPADEQPEAGYDFGFFPTCTSVCDVDMNESVDTNDFTAIFGSRGQVVSPPGLPNSGDCNRDGILSGNDVRSCLLFRTP